MREELISENLAERIEYLAAENIFELKREIEKRRKERINAGEDAIEYIINVGDDMSFFVVLNKPEASRPQQEITSLGLAIGINEELGFRFAVINFLGDKIDVSKEIVKKDTVLSILILSQCKGSMMDLCERKKVVAFPSTKDFENIPFGEQHLITRINGINKIGAIRLVFLLRPENKSEFLRKNPQKMAKLKRITKNIGVGLGMATASSLIISGTLIALSHGEQLEKFIFQGSLETLPVMGFAFAGLSLITALGTFLGIRKCRSLFNMLMKRSKDIFAETFKREEDELKLASVRVDVELTEESPLLGEVK